MYSIPAMPERTEEAIRRRLERLRERLGAEPDEGWLFARIAEALDCELLVQLRPRTEAGGKR